MILKIIDVNSTKRITLEKAMKYNDNGGAEGEVFRAVIWEGDGEDAWSVVDWFETVCEDVANDMAKFYAKEASNAAQ